MHVSLGVQSRHGGVDGAIERLGIRKGLMGQMMGFEIVPHILDVVEFRRVLEMVMPSRALISAMRRASVQLGRPATGASSNGAATLNAASVLTGAGPGAGLVFSASTPPRAKSLRHRRTVSSRTPKASAMRGLVQPERVSNTARARSASARSRDAARACNAVFCSSLAVTGDLPAMLRPRESGQRPN